MSHRNIDRLVAKLAVRMSKTLLRMSQGGAVEELRDELEDLEAAVQDLKTSLDEEGAPFDYIGWARSSPAAPDDLSSLDPD